MVLAFAFTAHRDGSGNSSPSNPDTAVIVTGPKANPVAATDCEKVIEKLPVTLQGLKPRKVNGKTPAVDTTYVVAWGDPAIVLSCGVERPSELKPGSSAGVTDTGIGNNTVQFFESRSGKVVTFTSIDRDVYIAIDMPDDLNERPLPLLAEAIASALPAVCQAVPQPIPSNYDESNAKLCVNRPR